MTRRHLALLLLLPLLFGSSPTLLAQATPTASRLADLQLGAGFALGHSAYEPGVFRGVTAYADVDLRQHLGAELLFHQINSPSGNSSFQRTYEIGARYHRTWGPLMPYVRAMYGRGDFNYPYGFTDLSYNLFAAGAGADYPITDSIRLRADYEFQRWSSFPNGGLHPQIVTIALAFHFPGRLRSK